MRSSLVKRVQHGCTCSFFSLFSRSLPSRTLARLARSLFASLSPPACFFILRLFTRDRPSVRLLVSHGFVPLPPPFAFHPFAGAVQLVCGLFATHHSSPLLPPASLFSSVRSPCGCLASPHDVGGGWIATHSPLTASPLFYRVRLLLVIHLIAVSLFSPAWFSSSWHTLFILSDCLFT